MDAHSMLRDGLGGFRWANADSMAGYVDRLSFERTVDRVSDRQGREEAMFLGLRLLEGVPVAGLEEAVLRAARECEEAGLVSVAEGRLRLTGRGRMVSNEVFERLLVEGEERSLSISR